MIFLQKTEQELNLGEDRMCLDFLNTASWHASSQPEERLLTYADLVKWAKSINLFSDTDANRLLAEASKNNLMAENALRKAVNLREAIYRIFSAQANQTPFNPADLAFINESLVESLDHTRLISSEGGFFCGWETDPGSLDSILWPVVRSTVDLMVSPEMRFIKICADDRGCGWAFLDLSHNHNRRWCSMKSCGNRAKAQRHYQKVISS